MQRRSRRRRRKVAPVERSVERHGDWTAAGGQGISQVFLSIRIRSWRGTPSLCSYNSRFPWRNSRKFDRHESFFPRNISHHREQFERRKESGSKRWTNRVRSSRIGSEIVSGGRELNVDDNSGASKQRVGRSVALVLARSTVCGAAHVHSLSLSPSPSGLMEDNDGGRARKGGECEIANKT